MSIARMARQPRPGISQTKQPIRHMKKAKQKASRPQDNPTVHAPDAAPTQEQIRERAHHIYLARGSVDRRDLENWLQTER